MYERNARDPMVVLFEQTKALTLGYRISARRHACQRFEQSPLRLQR